MNSTYLSSAPASDSAYVRASAELRSLMARRQKAAKTSWVWALVGLLIGSGLIGIATSLPFLSLGWPIWAAVILGLFFHLLAAYAVHWWRSDKGWLSRIGLIVFIACCLAFFGLALWRASAFLIMGVAPPINYVLSIGLWLFEVAVPLGLGTMFATATVAMRAADANFGFFDNFARKIAAVPSDASGLWSDKRMSVEEELLDAETAEDSTAADIEPLKERLRLLKEYQPYRRFDERDPSGPPPMGGGPGGTNPPDKLSVPARNIDSWPTAS